MRRLIVGIDPGLYTAVVILDLKGNVISYTSQKNMGEEKIINFILSYGKPILIATDVKKTPKLIQKISARFSANTFTPERDLKKEEKEKLSYFQDPHLRDAHAAALKAYHHYENRFRNIDKKLPPDKAEEEKERVVKGIFNINIEETKERNNSIQKTQQKEKDGQKKKEKENCKEKITLLRKIINDYKKEISTLKELVKEKDKIIAKLLRRKLTRKRKNHLRNKANH